MPLIMSDVYAARRAANKPQQGPFVPTAMFDQKGFASDPLSATASGVGNVVSGISGSYAAGSGPQGAVGKRMWDSPIMPGGPQYPGFLKIRGADQMLPPHLQSKLNTKGLEALRAQSQDTGLSDLNQLKMQQMQTQQAQAGDAQAGQMQGMWNRVGQAANPELAARQMGRMQMEQAGMGNQPEMALHGQNRAEQLQKLRQQPLLELQALQPQQFNIQNALQEKAAEEQAKLQSYDEQYKAFGAAQTAGAMMQPRKKFLGMF